MKGTPRTLERLIVDAARAFPAVVLYGPRRAGKTFMLRRLLPDAGYVLLEDPDVLARAKADPRALLEGLRQPAILDEVQNVPELFAFVRTLVEAQPRRVGQWFLTGSQDFALLEGVTESIAGRAAVFQLLPFSSAELGRWDLLRGGFPEVWARPKQASLWFSSYLHTYLERDVRTLLAVRDLATFRRFIALLASRNGQILNMTDLAAPLGITVPTVAQWIGVLETTGLVYRVTPYYENFEKRLIKSPKLYWLDTGLLCFLLGITSQQQLEASPFIGAVFEAFVASEILKAQANDGRPRALHFFRDQQGLEVDFLVPAAGGELVFVEVKWSRTPRPEMARPMLALLPRVEGRPARGFVVHRAPPRSARPRDGARAEVGPTALGPSVTSVTVEALLDHLAPRTFGARGTKGTNAR